MRKVIDQITIPELNEMSNFQAKLHKDLELESWARQSIFEIMGNIGSEVNRTIKWKAKGKNKMWQAAFDRSLELFDISKQLKTLPSSQMRELCRSREVWCDYVVGDNEYNSTAENIQRYFDQFAIAARISFVADRS